MSYLNLDILRNVMEYSDAKSIFGLTSGNRDVYEEFKEMIVPSSAIEDFIQLISKPENKVRNERIRRYLDYNDEKFQKYIRENIKFLQSKTQNIDFMNILELMYGAKIYNKRYNIKYKKPTNDELLEQYSLALENTDLGSLYNVFNKKLNLGSSVGLWVTMTKLCSIINDDDELLKPFYINRLYDYGTSQLEVILLLELSNMSRKIIEDTSDVYPENRTYASRTIFVDKDIPRTNVYYKTSILDNVINDYFVLGKKSIEHYDILFRYLLKLSLTQNFTLTRRFVNLIKLYLADPVFKNDPMTPLVYKRYIKGDIPIISVDIKFKNYCSAMYECSIKPNVEFNNSVDYDSIIMNDDSVSLQGIGPKSEWWNFTNQTHYPVSTVVKALLYSNTSYQKNLIIQFMEKYLMKHAGNRRDNISASIILAQPDINYSALLHLTEEMERTFYDLFNMLYYALNEYNMIIDTL